MTFRYYIAGQRVYPFNTRELSLKTKRESGYIFYRDKLEGEIVCADMPKDSVEDYTMLMSIENGTHTTYTRTDNIPLDIKVLVGTEESLYWSGEFTMNDCEFDIERGIIKVKPTVKDDYSEFFERQDVKINLLDITDREIIYLKKYSDIQFIKASSAPNATWKLFSTFIYAREVLVLPDGVTPSGWTDVTDDDNENNIHTWARQWDIGMSGITDYVIYEEFAPPYYKDDYYGNPTEFDMTRNFYRVASVNVPGGWNVYLYTDYDGIRNSQEYTIRTSMTFKDVIEYLVAQTAPNFTGEVKSSFFWNDNADSTYLSEVHATQNMITNRANELNNLYIVEKSDFLFPSASEAAITGEITFKNFFDDLNKLFAANVWWFIDPDGNFRIEYIHYFNRRIGLNLTNETYEDFIIYSRDYKYKKNAVPSREIWDFNEAGSTDFVENEITYGDFIAIDGIKENKTEYSISYLLTDVNYINRKYDEVSTDGFVLICCEDVSGEWHCKEAIGKLSGVSVQNGDLSLANILYDYGRHDRPLEEFTMNATLTEAITTKKLKEQVEIEFVNFEEEKIDLFKLISTQYGLSELDEGNDNFEKGTIKVKVNNVIL